MRTICFDNEDIKKCKFALVKQELTSIQSAFLGQYILNLEQENQELKKQLEDLFNENSKLRKKLEKSMTFQDYEHTLNKKIQLENQQKEYIEQLEKLAYQDMIPSDFANGCKVAYGIALNRYKEMIGVKDE